MTSAIAISLLPPTYSVTSLPEECVLNPRFDAYLDQEVHKVEESRYEWRCEYCHKTFKNEFYMDRHMDNKHTDKIPVRNLSHVSIR